MFEQHIHKQQLFAKNNKLILAFSGGVDSVVLATLLLKLNYKFELAHCNFNLRGKESEKDESFCKSFAKNHNLKIHVQNFDTKSYMKIKKLSVQMAARELRYHWFNQLVKVHHYDFIVTAHHANDTIETLLVNLIRGTGINGLIGIPDKQNKIVRPLLFFSKHEILTYAEKNKINFRHDSSNDEVKYARNYLRHKIINDLKKINPSVEKTLLNNIELFKQAALIVNAYSTEKRKQFVKENKNRIEISYRNLLKETSPHLLLHEWLAPFGFNSSQTEQLFESLKEKSTGKLFLSENYQLLINRESILVEPKQTLETNDEEFEIKSVVEFQNLPIKIVAVKTKSKSLSTDKNIGLFDADLIKFPLQLRKWKQGDKFMPLGMNNFKKLSDFFISNKIPLTEKNKIWLLVNANEEIIWVVGKRIDDRFKVSPDTKSILKLELKNNG